MDAWIWIVIILAIMVIVLFFMMNKKNAQIALAKQQETREWTLKTALEKTFNLPSVDAKELASIEGQLDQMMNSSGADEEVEEKMRLTVMELYAKKAEKQTNSAPKPKKKNPIIGEG